MITIWIKDQGIGAHLTAIAQSITNLRPLMNEVGATVQENTLLAFRDSRSPDGAAWQGLSAVTKKRRRGGGGKPLQDTGRLRASIAFVAADNSVSIGTNVVSAPTHQFGAAKGAYGRTRRGGPIPWGNIPARPFLGISLDSRSQILAAAAKHIGIKP